MLSSGRNYWPKVEKSEKERKKNNNIPSKGEFGGEDVKQSVQIPCLTWKKLGPKTGSMKTILASYRTAAAHCRLGSQR